ncbi:MAG: CHAT domain-containing protein [Leptolyngbya sp. Prado105]|jgi:CHAT domain-containing protein|nr:CHAT domain-containing protein [Leptolyngbya sp. Prado105]
MRKLACEALTLILIPAISPVIGIQPLKVEAQVMNEGLQWLEQAQQLEKQGKFSQAIVLYQKALTSYEKSRDRQMIAEARWMLGNAYVKLSAAGITNRSDQQSALEHLEQALSMSRDTQNTWLELKTLISIVLLDPSFLAEQGKFQPYIEQAISAIKKTQTDIAGVEPPLPQDENSQAIQQRIKNEAGSGESLLFSTLNSGRKLVYDEAFNRYQFKDLEGLFAIEQTILGLALSSTVSEQENQAYVNNFQYSTSAIISFSQQVSDRKATELALNTVLNRKGIILDLLRRESLRLPSVESMLQARQELLSKAFAVFSQRYSQELIIEAQFPPGIKRLERDSNVAFMQQIGLEGKAAIKQSDDNQALQAKAGLSDWEAVQRVLPKDSALVEFIKYRPYRLAERDRWGAPRYAAYLLSSTGAAQTFDLGNASEIDSLLVQFRQKLDDKLSDVAQLKAVAQKLEAKLTRPIRTKLGNTQRLFLSPDDQLNLLPFDALVDETDRYLVETYDISYLSSGRDLIQLKYLQSDRPQQNALIIADPDFSSRPSTAASRRSSGLNLLECCDRLSSTAEEAKILQQILPKATVLTRQQATKAAIQQAKAPSILHIATHGFFLPDQVPPLYAQAIAPASSVENPMLRSGLALAGFDPKSNQFEGALSALEVQTLNLRGTELVVLSACQTGVGEIKNGEGVYGLRRAFILAGAKSLVLSLWNVDDQATYSLMSSYYNRLLQGESRSIALQETQRTMLKSGRFSHPHYWAGFFHSGDWSPLSQKIF